MTYPTYLASRFHLTANTIIKACVFLVFVHFISVAGAQNLEWAKATQSAGNGLAIAVDDSGNVITAGEFYGTADFDAGPGVFNLTSKGGDDVFIVKYNASGAFVWARSFGSKDGEDLAAVAIDGSGNIYTTGTFYGTADMDPGSGDAPLTSAGGGDVFISKLDNNGNFVWGKKVGGPDENDIGISLTVDRAGNLTITGTFYGLIDINPGTSYNPLNAIGYQDIFILRLDPAGAYAWARRIGDQDMDHVSTIVHDLNNNLYVGGTFRYELDFDPNPGSEYKLKGEGGWGDVFVLKLTDQGNFIWARNFGGPGNEYIESHALTVDSSGSIYMSGRFFGTTDFDPGTPVFTMLADSTRNLFVSKLNGNGNFVWAKAFRAIPQSGVPDDCMSNAIGIDHAGDIYVLGNFTGTFDFDPGAAQHNLSAVEFSDMFLLKLDSFGNFGWAASTGGSDADVANAMAIDLQSNIYSTGKFMGKVDFEPGPATYYLNGSTWFISKISQRFPMFTDESLAPTLVQIFPNPAEETITVKLPENTTGTTYQIFDRLGSLVLAGKFNSLSGNITLQGLAPGIYYLQLGNMSSEVWRLVKR